RNEDTSVLYFGRLSREKGVEDLVRAAERLPQIRLMIAGDGPERSALESLAQSLNLQNVKFIGHVIGADLESRIAQSSFTVFPSHAYETLGKTILESYAQGRAVVATDLGPRREIVQEDRTGLLYPAGDIKRLADAIEWLGSQPTVAERMGQAGREWVRQKFT